MKIDDAVLKTLEYARDSIYLPCYTYFELTKCIETKSLDHLSDGSKIELIKVYKNLLLPYYEAITKNKRK